MTTSEMPTAAYLHSSNINSAVLFIKDDIEDETVSSQEIKGLNWALNADCSTMFKVRLYRLYLQGIVSEDYVQQVWNEYNYLANFAIKTISI